MEQLAPGAVLTLALALAPGRPPATLINSNPGSDTLGGCGIAVGWGVGVAVGSGAGGRLVGVGSGVWSATTPAIGIKLVSPRYCWPL